MLAATTWRGLARGLQMARSRQQRRPDRSCKRHPREALAHGLRGGKDMVGRRVHPTLAHGSVVHGAGPSHGPNGDWHNVHSFSAVVRRGQRYSSMSMDGSVENRAIREDSVIHQGGETDASMWHGDFPRTSVP